MSSNDFDRVTAAAIEGKIFELLANRRAGATICPSEVARGLLSNHGPWRELMPQVRQVAQALAKTNRLTVTRGGMTVDATSPGGPIRLGHKISRDGT